MVVAERLRELGWELPSAPKPAGVYVPAKLWQGTLYVSGHTPKVNGQNVFVGKVGREVTLEQAQEGARLAVLGCLAQAAAVLGDLDRVAEVLKVLVFVNSAPGFGDQPKVANGASEALVALFGERGRHARSAIGVAELPGGASVEVELVVGVQEQG